MNKLIIFLLCLLFSYLSISLVLLDLNLLTWHMSARGFLLFIAYLLYLKAIEYRDKKRKEK